MKFLKALAVILVLLVVIGLLVGREDDTITTEAIKSQPAHQTRSSVNCDHGTPIAGRFFVKGRDINFRSGPGTNHDRRAELLPNAHRR